MERKTVTSSLLKSVGYDAATETLEVQFKNNDKFLYRYAEVPMVVALKMSQSESMGKFYLREIKPVYKCTRIEEKDEDQKEEQDHSAAPPTDTEDTE